MIPNILGSIIPYNPQPTRVLNTAQMFPINQPIRTTIHHPDMNRWYCLWYTNLGEQKKQVIDSNHIDILNQKLSDWFLGFSDPSKGGPFGNSPTLANLENRLLGRLVWYCIYKYNIIHIYIYIHNYIHIMFMFMFMFMFMYVCMYVCSYAGM